MKGSSQVRGVEVRGGADGGGGGGDEVVKWGDWVVMQYKKGVPSLPNTNMF